MTEPIKLPDPKYPGTKANIPNAIPDLYTADQVRAAIEADRQTNRTLMHYMPETIAALKAAGCNESLVTDIEKATRGEADRQANQITGETSDGYHTFNELYAHRVRLFCLLMHAHKNSAWWSRKHHDGSAWEGWVIAGIDTPEGSATYHLPESEIENLPEGTELPNGKEWDGHTSDDVLVRLLSLRQARGEPVAWGAFYFGGKRNWKLYSQSETEAQIDAYIDYVHRSNDSINSITLRKGPLYTTPQPQQIPESSPLRESMSSNHRSYAEGWNACRAAMLEAAPEPKEKP